MWTQPSDLELGGDSLLEELLGEREFIYYARFDGSVQTLTRELDEEQLRALLTRAGGDSVVD